MKHVPSNAMPEVKKVNKSMGGVLCSGFVLGKLSLLPIYHWPKEMRWVRQKSRSEEIHFAQR